METWIGIESIAVRLECDKDQSIWSCKSHAVASSSAFDVRELIPNGGDLLWQWCLALFRSVRSPNAWWLPHKLFHTVVLVSFYD